MNSTERAFYGSPFWAQKGTFFKCSDKNESFYLQKVCFSDREKFSEPPPRPKIGKTQHNAFLWVALENSAQRFPMGRVGKLSTTLFMNRVGKLNTTLFMNRVVGWVMARSTIRVLCLFSQAM
ncbi:hypothetical protein LEP1GSC080_3585, partial [Leptospira interrogans str. FPW2026]